ncbi:hypothetical protein [Mucilaginibacter sp.]|jgi:hypothetical protein|uniref:hypothetical protein n=1 Tax=Mucilaginibacter sp. TaxID=1882438 RepID=UPI003567BE64
MGDTLFPSALNGEHTLNDHSTVRVNKEADINKPVSVIEQEPQAIPLFVRKRLRGWFIAFWGFTVCRYLFGIGGVLASTIAAVSADAGIRTYCSVIAAICIAIIGFVKPDDSYRRHVVAWRYLDAKANLYAYKLISIKELLNAMSEAEQMIDLTERNITTNTVSAGS